MARQCREMGVQVNFAPVADVNINPNNPVINTRSFGEDPDLVAQKVIAYGRGLEDHGVLAVAKHFPGHGDTDKDSHYALPVLGFSRDRLDSIEIYPFDEAIRAGLNGMMVGHLYVPALESSNRLPSSLSRNIVTNLLTQELGFSVLIFTDALAMKGVAGNKNVCLMALQAGNDIVLSPPNLKEEIDAVLSAVHDDQFSRAEVERKCRKVLTYKYMLGLNKRPHIQQSGLENRLNTAEAAELIRQLNLAAITVLGNEENTLPLVADKNKTSIALLSVAGKTNSLVLKQGMDQYAQVKSFRLNKAMNAAERKQLYDTLAQYPQVVVSICEPELNDYQLFFNEWALEYPDQPVVYTFFVPAKSPTQIEGAIQNAQSTVSPHSPPDDLQKQVADILFGRATADDRLSASIGDQFAMGDGVTVMPGMAGDDKKGKDKKASYSFRGIDNVVADGIAQGAMPGCQVVVMKDGELIFQKSYGTYSGAGSQPVQNSNLYDLASLSKTTGTLLGVMKLYDKGMFNLSDKVSDYLVWLKGTNKENITIRELLFHQSGLPASIGFYQELFDKDSYKGSLYSGKRDAKYSAQIGPKQWANPDFKYKADITSPVRTDECTLQVCDGLCVNQSYRQLMRDKIAAEPMMAKTYRYSDVGFVLLQYLIEEISGMPMNDYLIQEFYDPMKLDRITYLPRQRFDKDEIVPSNRDNFARQQVLQGYVHDETAAYQGGVAGSAGLFGNAEQVAIIYQMMLDGGVYKGKRYLGEETCRVFTTETSKISRRGLGYDKPEPDPNKIGPCSPSTPSSVLGHTGFTGTGVWADPENNLVYVFLSNRTYPNAWNRKLLQMDIRPNIQEEIYKAINKK